MPVGDADSANYFNKAVSMDHIDDGEMLALC